MKKLLFPMLIAAVGAGAYFTRPENPKQSLADFLVEHEGRDPRFAKVTADTSNFQDRYLWVDVKQGDKTIYTSVFHRWIDRDAEHNAVRSAAWDTVQRVTPDLAKDSVRDIVRDVARRIAAEQLKDATTQPANHANDKSAVE